jgi:hypothetical protein
MEFLTGSLLMAVLAQPFFALVRRDFMTLSFSTARHGSYPPVDDYMQSMSEIWITG